MSRGAQWRRIGVVVGGGASLVLAVLMVVSAERYRGTSWLGIPLLPNGTVGPSILTTPADGAVPDVGFQDRVVALDGVPVDDARSLGALLRGRAPGTTVELGLEHAGGGGSRAIVTLQRFELSTFWFVYGPLLLGGLTGIALGAAPILARPNDPAAVSWFLFNLGLGVNFGILTFDWFVAHRLTPWGSVAGALAVGGLLHLGLSLPRPLAPLRHFPRAAPLACYAVGGAFFASYGVALSTSVTAVRWLDWVEIGLISVGTLTLFWNIVRTAREGAATRARRQARVLLAGVAVAVPGGLAFLATLEGRLHGTAPVAAYLLPLWCLGFLVAYAMIRENLFELDALARQTIMVGLVLLACVLVAGGVFVVLRPLVQPATGWAVASVLAVVSITAATAVPGLRERLEAGIESRLFPHQHHARQAVHDATRELGRLLVEDELLQLVRDVVGRAMHPEWVRLCAGSPTARLDEVACSAGPPLVLAPSDPLHALAQSGTSLALDVHRPREPGAAEASARADELGVRLAVALPPTPHLVGTVLLGRRGDGRLYTRDDLMLLETLCAHVGVALENARAWATVRKLEQRLAAENHYLREELAAERSHGDIVGKSAAIRAVLAQIERIAPTDATVLVVGETGTGKELVVRALHEGSPRRAAMLVKVACGALPEALLESELFGHERGAFTGAVAAKPGRLEVADRGTLFLDDVDNLSLGVQAKLLRALEQKETQRLGSNRVRTVDVRIVAATNRDLLASVRAGAFREDLYYRLNVVPIQLPSLRERREDIPLLVEHLVAREGARLGRRVREVSAAALAELEAWHWPGNVRELRNVVERALVLGDGDVLRLPAPLSGDAPAAAAGVRPGGSSGPAATTAVMTAAEQVTLAAALEALKVRLIREALAASAGNRRIAAERLGLHRQSLTRMMRDLGLREASDDDT